KLLLDRCGPSQTLRNPPPPPACHAGPRNVDLYLDLNVDARLRVRLASSCPPPPPEPCPVITSRPPPLARHNAWLPQQFHQSNPRARLESWTRVRTEPSRRIWQRILGHRLL